MPPVWSAFLLFVPAAALLGAGRLLSPDPRLTQASEGDRVARAAVLCEGAPASRAARDNFTAAAQRGSGLEPGERAALADLEREIAALEAGMGPRESLGAFRERFMSVLYRLETPPRGEFVVTPETRAGAEARCYLPAAALWCERHPGQEEERCRQAGLRLAALTPALRAAAEQRLAQRQVSTTLDFSGRIAGFGDALPGDQPGTGDRRLAAALAVSGGGGADAAAAGGGVGRPVPGARPGAVPTSAGGNDAGAIAAVMRRVSPVPPPGERAGAEATLDGSAAGGVVPPAGAVTGGVAGVGGRRYDRASADEIALITRTFDASVAAMVAEGRRVDGSGGFMGFVNNQKSTWGSGRVYRCYDQAHRVLGDLARVFGTSYSEGSGRFTDPSGKWTFTFSTYWGQDEIERDGHYWVQAVSAVPEDPTLIIDPWLNRIERRPEKAPIIAKGYAAYWTGYVLSGGPFRSP